MFLIVDIGDFISYVCSANSQEVFEWQSHHLNGRLANSQAWNSHLGYKKGDLNFSLIELAHAILRTDMLSNKRYHDLEIATLVYIFRLLKDNGRGVIATIDDLNEILSDFVLTSYIGRIGQGFSLLLCYRKGLNFVTHSSKIFPRNKFGSGGLADFVFLINKGLVLY